MLLGSEGYLLPEKVKFYVNENGFTAMKYGEDVYKRVKLLRSCPQTKPYEYVCVFDEENKEIGIIEKLEQLDKESLEVAKKELSDRYFCPEITEIVSVKDRAGRFFFDCKIGEYKKNFTVKDISRNVFNVNGVIRMVDVDGNRYIVRFDKISKKSKRLIEPYLY